MYVFYKLYPYFSAVPQKNEVLNFILSINAVLRVSALGAAVSFVQIQLLRKIYYHLRDCK